MAFTVIGGWKKVDESSTLEHVYTGNLVYHWEREVKTIIFRCWCDGTDELPQQQNPGGLALPWLCMNKHFVNPRGGYKEYEETWQINGKWNRVEP